MRSNARIAITTQNRDPRAHLNLIGRNRHRRKIRRVDAYPMPYAYASMMIDRTIGEERERWHGHTNDNTP